MNTWIKAIAIFFLSITFSVVYSLTDNVDFVWTVVFCVYLLIGVLLVVTFERIKRKIVIKHNPTQQEIKTIFSAMEFLQKKRDFVLQCQLREALVLMVCLLCSVCLNFICIFFIHFIREVFSIFRV